MALLTISSFLDCVRSLHAIGTLFKYPEEKVFSMETAGEGGGS